MKKFLSAAVALLLACSMFCGCGVSGSDGNTSDGNDGQDITGPSDSGNNNQDDSGDNTPEDENKEPEEGDGKPNDENNDPEEGGDEDNQDGDNNDEPEIVDPPVDENDWLNTAQGKTNLSADGYVRGNIGNFSRYVGTDAYRVVTTTDELVSALAAAKCNYKNVWIDSADDVNFALYQAEKGYTEEDLPVHFQVLNSEGAVHVIEIANDLDFGYNKLSAAAKSNSSIVENFNRKTAANESKYTMSEMFIESGISQFKVENTSDLLIYSKNGAKITHGGFKLTSDNNVAFRNLEFDELWQWEDAADKSAPKVGDYDAFGWAYFKISFSNYIWIDHCTFGKSYDGQIDYSNPVYDANAGTYFRAPYGCDGNNGLHISFCKFNAGSDDENGYIYKMMENIESNYQANLSDSTVPCKYLYYKALRDGGISFEDILYGLAMPQKKGFLCGDDAKFSSADALDDYNFNLKLQVSFANCIFKNLEDRLPKLRGGNAYMYNCIVDSSQYYAYRTKLKAANAASKVTAVNSGWKCALVSQGMLCGNGGSVKAENCIFKGIDSLLKNNDTKNSGEYVKGGYQLVNCSYQKAASDTPVVGSTASGTNFPNSSSSTLSTSKFEWHTVDGHQPFEIVGIELDELEEVLTGKYGVGVNMVLQEKLLISNYQVD